MTEADHNSQQGPWHLLRQPLIQFLALGLLLFGLYLLLGDRRQDEGKKIVVSAQRIELLASLWQKQWRRPPTPDELDGLIRSAVREEILYREALAMGLDRDDTVIRRRLAQKLEFLAQDLASQVEPTPVDLETFYAEHAEIFQEPARITFTHVYVNVDTHGADSATVADDLLTELRAGGDPGQLGDRFMLQSLYLRKSPDEVARHFGGQFSAAVFEVEVGEWAGPLRSGYGLHLVLVSNLAESYLRPLEEVRDKVKNELISFRRREMDENLYARLREGYEVVIEGAGPAAAADRDVPIDGSS